MLTLTLTLTLTLPLTLRRPLTLTKAAETAASKSRLAVDDPETVRP